MATIETALRIAADAHAGQTDKQGAPYILHPLRVMARVEDLSAKIVAVLHDVVEDTPVSLDDLRSEGFEGEILDAVDCVTHREGESYADYVVRCKSNPIAIQVKLADLADNSLLSRTLLREDRLRRDLARQLKYGLTYQFLTDRIDEKEYRHRLEQKW